MSTKIDQRVNIDQLKLGLATILLLCGVLGFYYFDGISNLFRVSGFIMVVGTSIGLFWATSKGKETVAFLKEAQVEVKSRMADPTGNIADDFFVLVVVVIFAILLWLLDLLLSSIVGTLI